MERCQPAQVVGKVLHHQTRCLFALLPLPSPSAGLQPGCWPVPGDKVSGKQGSPHFCHSQSHGTSAALGSFFCSAFCCGLALCRALLPLSPAGAAFQESSEVLICLQWLLKVADHSEALRSNIKCWPLLWGYLLARAGVEKGFGV